MSNGEKNTVRYLTKLPWIVLGAVLCAAAVFAPPIGGLSQSTQAMLGVAALMTTWWVTEAVPIPITSLVPLVLFPTLGLTTMSEAATPYAHHLIFLFLGGFVLALGIERTGLHKRIALNIVRVLGGEPKRLILGFMVATALLSMWISNTATAMMMLPIALAVNRNLAERRYGQSDLSLAQRKSMGVPLLLGIAYAASIGGVGTLIGTPPNVILGGVYESLTEGAELGFFQWMLFAVPLVVVMIPLVWFLLTHWILPLDSEGWSYGGGSVREELSALGPVSPGERRVLVIFILTALAWIFRTPIEFGDFATPGLTEIFPELKDSTIAIMAGIALFLVPMGGRDSGAVMDWKAVKHGVPWGVLLLFGGGFALAVGFESTGVTALVGQAVEGLGAVPVILLILAVCAMVTFLTELTSNTATAAILLPIMASVAAALGHHSLLLMIPVAVSASFAFMLPVATPPNAIVFGSELIEIRDMARAGIFLNLTGIILITIWVVVIGSIVFGY